MTGAKVAVFAAACALTAHVHGRQVQERDETAPLPSSADHMMLQVTSAAKIQKLRRDLLAPEEDPIVYADGDDCCSKCSGSAACSPYSRNCYDTKKKDYYLSCGCCSKCGDSNFCSPNSWNCYNTKNKDYYLQCKDTTTATTTSTTTSTCTTTASTTTAAAENCCSKCGDSYFCSPNSFNCYDTKNKDYYLQCKETTTTTTTVCVGDACPLGWPTGGGEKKGYGRWCEVAVPPADWTALKTCPTGSHKQTLKVLTYNLFWWNLMERRRGENGRAGRKIAATNAPEAYDFMGFQESKDVDRIMRDARRNGLPDEYETLSLVWEDRALGMAYRSTVWTLLDDGHEDVGEDRRDQYYGRRAVLWGRFKHTSGLTAFFINHHGPLPVSAGGSCAGAATAYNIMRVIAQNSKPGDAVVLVGDFNAQKHSSRVKALDAYMNRVYTGTSFDGVDHVYSNCGGEAVLKKENLGTGGSDHDALSVMIEFSGNVA